MAIPVFRVSAYGCFVSGEHILLSRLARGPAQGKWTLIGGGIDHGETPLEALRRETREEAGIDLVGHPTPELLEVLSQRVPHRNSKGEDVDLHMVGIVYALEFPDRVECRAEGDGGSSAGSAWIRRSELTPDNSTAFVQEALRAWDRA